MIGKGEGQQRGRGRGRGKDAMIMMTMKSTAETQWTDERRRTEMSTPRLRRKKQASNCLTMQRFTMLRIVL